jgi:hypothetical protein
MPFEFKCGLSWNKKPILDLVRVSREIGILGLKNENPCFEIFYRVPGSWFRLGGGEESQGFSEVKNLKFENGFWPCLLSIISFPELSSVSQTDE